LLVVSSLSAAPPGGGGGAFLLRTDAVRERAERVEAVRDRETDAVRSRISFGQ
jgi:hypothetical protein